MAPKAKAAPKPGATLAAWVDGRKGVEGGALALVDVRSAYGLQQAFKNRCPTALVSTSGSDGTDEPPRKRAKHDGWDGTTLPCECPPGHLACLNRVGHMAWEARDGKKARRRMMTAAGLRDNPSEDSRDPDRLVGLKNLGATCYMNSYLQTWFQNRDFRRGVFACRPSGSEKPEDSPLFQLQVIFAALQEGVSGVHNPKPLVTSLRLQETEQQDAQEFGKLFIDLLAHEFQSQTEPSTASKSLITDLGDMRYRTVCKSCGHSSERKDVYTELTINLAPNCWLDKQLDASLATEDLKGANKYECGNCEKMRDATRYTELVSIPPVLHFSLLRFVYDAKSEDRKKSNAFINFYRVIDMSKWLAPSAANADERVLYDLTAVLDHRGQSAHHGHYVAQVYDPAQDKWFKCDDEQCEVWTAMGSFAPANAINLDSDDDQSTDKHGGSPSPKSPPKIRSKDAYMLVYTRRPATQLTPKELTALDKSLEPPSRALDVVEALANEKEQAVQTYDEIEKVVNSAFEAALEAKRSVYSVWDVSAVNEAVFVATEPLEAWMASIPDVPELSESTAPKPVTNGVNGHAKTNGTATSPSPAANGHVDGSSVPTAASDVEMVDATAAPDPATKIDSSFLLCEHGKLDPTKVELTRIIDRAGLVALQALGVEVTPVLTMVDDLCVDCVRQALARKSFWVKHPADVTHFRSRMGSASSSNGYLISSAWLKDWLLAKPKLFDTSTGTYPSPSSPSFAAHVVCQHGGLQPSGEESRKLSQAAALVLQKLFPDYEPIEDSLETCGICTPDGPVADDESKAQHARQKHPLRDLKAHPTTFSVLKTVPDTTYYLIPRAWLFQLQDFIRKDTKPMPPSIDLVQYHCDHAGLKFDVRLDADVIGWVAVSETHWTLIKTFYEIEGEAIAMDVSEHFERRSYPAVCVPCREESIRDFSTATVSIRKLLDSDFDSAGNKRPVEDIDRLERGAAPAEVSENPGARRSSRRTGSSKPTKHETTPLDIDKLDTVKELKLKIHKIYDVPTIYQHLWHGDRALDDSSETVAAIGILPGDVIDFRKFEARDAEVDVSKLRDHVPKRNGKSSNGATTSDAVVEGFAGTGLHGFEARRRERDLSSHSTPNPATDVDNDAEMAAALAVELNGPEASTVSRAVADAACPSCTYLQSGENDKCEICEQPMR